MAKKVEEKKQHTTFGAMKKAVVKAAEAVVEKATEVAEAANVHVVQPVAEAVGIKDKKPVKKPRFVRPAVAKKPRAKVAKADRSTTPAGKLMSKNLAELPKDEVQTAPKSKGKAKR